MLSLRLSIPCHKLSAAAELHTCQVLLADCGTVTQWSCADAAVPLHKGKQTMILFSDLNSISLRRLEKKARMFAYKSRRPPNLRVLARASHIYLGALACVSHRSITEARLLDRRRRKAGSGSWPRRPVTVNLDGRLGTSMVQEKKNQTRK